VFIHIEPHKTGTTAIQASLAASRDALAGSGYQYLSGDPNHSMLLATVFWDEGSAYKLGYPGWIDDPNEFLRHRQKLYSLLIEEVDRSTCDALILSGEELSRFNEAEAERLVEFLRARYDAVKVIAYVREPLSWSVSSSQQRTKWSGKTLEQIFDSLVLPNYARRFNPYIRLVGESDFDLRIYSGKSSEFDVIVDFARAVGIDPGLLNSPNENDLNIALTHPSAVMLSAINEYSPPYVQNRHNPCRAFRVVKDARLPGRAFTLPRETVVSALDDLERERAWTKAYFGREIFPDIVVPEQSRSNWFDKDRAALEDHGRLLNEAFRASQNEVALKHLWKAQESRKIDPTACQSQLSRALLLSTDRWTMHHVATMMLETEHPERRKALAKQKLMRQIEAPEPADPPLIVENPFNRF
jgi:hypothetical protein